MRTITKDEMEYYKMLLNIQLALHIHHVDSLEALEEAHHRKTWENEPCVCNGQDE